MSVTKSDGIFRVNGDIISYATQYKYLGIVLTEHLDYAITAKLVAQSANRALGLLIAKSKAFGGLQYDAFTKLYDSMVCPVILYGAAVWGTQSYKCINAVQNRAARYFLNVGRYTPNAAVNGDIGWIPIQIKCWKTVLSHWCRSVNMDATRLNRTIFLWSNAVSSNRCKNWNYRVKDMLNQANCIDFCDVNTGINRHAVFARVLSFLTETCTTQWHNDVNRDGSRTGNGGNKLRLYQTFKQSFGTESYCKDVFNRSHRGALAKFRSGTAPIALETGRYSGIPVNERHCFNCHGAVENEIHVLLHCQLYNTLRAELFAEANLICNEFDNLSDNDKIVFILSNPCIAKFSAKTCSLILNRRREVLFN